MNQQKLLIQRTSILVMDIQHFVGLRVDKHGQQRDEHLEPDQEHRDEEDDVADQTQGEEGDAGPQSISQSRQTEPDPQGSKSDGAEEVEEAEAHHHLLLVAVLEVQRQPGGSLGHQVSLLSDSVNPGENDILDVWVVFLQDLHREREKTPGGEHLLVDVLQGLLRDDPELSQVEISVTDEDLNGARVCSPVFLSLTGPYED